MSDIKKILCHADGDRCLGCSHYRGKSDKCEFAPTTDASPHTDAGALLKLADELISFFNFINEPPQYEDQRMVRDYRHELARLWMPLHGKINAALAASHGREGGEDELYRARDIIASHISCEGDCQKRPNGCGCALTAAREIVEGRTIAQARQEPTDAQIAAALEWALSWMRQHGVDGLSPFIDYPPIKETIAGMYRAMTVAVPSASSPAQEAGNSGETAQPVTGPMRMDLMLEKIDGENAQNSEVFNDMRAHIWAAGASHEDADFITRMLTRKGLYLFQTEPWKRCPSTHCERRGECAGPRDCIVKTPLDVSTVERCYQVVLQERCQRGTPWDLACTTIARKLLGLIGEARRAPVDSPSVPSASRGTEA